MKSLIYNQWEERERHYGLRSSGKTGCGWVAVYNALILLGEEPEKEEVISRLERMLPVIHGNAGTFCLAPKLFFDRLGYETELSIRDLDRAAERSDVSILFYYWHHGCRLGAHFITVYRENGYFYGLNVYRNAETPTLLGRNLTDFTKKQHGCILLGIKNPR